MALHGVTCRFIASQDVLSFLGKWLGPSQWLYEAFNLPPPHNTPDWASWYAAQLATRSGWTTVACVGAGSSEAPCVPTAPLETRFPAWQLVAERASRRAVLCVRGSSSPNDWQINGDAQPAGRYQPLQAVTSRYQPLPAVASSLHQLGGEL